MGAGLGLADGLGIYWEGSPHRGGQPVTEGAHDGSGLGGGQAAVDGECVSRAGKLGDFGHVFVAILMVRSVCHAAVVMPKTLR